MASTEPRPRRAGDRAGAILEIDLDAIAGNYRKLAERVGSNVRVAVVVKADAYGIGMEKVAPALARAGAKTFFVATLDEGLALRELLPRALLRQGRPGLRNGKHERCTIDAEERLSRRDLRAFVVQALLENAGDARSDLDLARAFRLADGFEHQRHALQRHALDGDRERGCCGRRRLRVAGAVALPAAGDGEKQDRHGEHGCGASSVCNGT